MIDNKELEEAANEYAMSMVKFDDSPLTTVQDDFISGATHQDKIAVDRTVDSILELLAPYKGLAEVYEQEIDTLITQIQNLKK